MKLPPRKQVLSRSKTLDFLDKLKKTPGEEGRSLYLPAGLPPAEVENLLKETLGQPESLPEMTKLAAGSGTGAVFFRGAEAIYLLLPPFPITERASLRGCSVEPLHALVQHNYRIALILVRLGSYAVGICDGENLISRKVGTGLVHGRHKKGGSSQQRFQRHREKQIEYFLSRVCQHAQEQLSTKASTLDYMVYGGAWTTIQRLQKQCPFLGQFRERTLPPLLEIPEPRQSVLEKAVSSVWSSTLIEWRED